MPNDNSPRAEVWLVEELSAKRTPYKKREFRHSVCSKPPKEVGSKQRIVRFVEAREGEGNGE